MRKKKPQVRRFEPGASGMGYDDMMLNAGYMVQLNGSSYRVWRVNQGGKPRVFTRKKFFALLDQVRMCKGLEPILLINKKSV